NRFLWICIFPVRCEGHAPAGDVRIRTHRRFRTGRNLAPETDLPRGGGDPLAGERQISGGAVAGGRRRTTRPSGGTRVAAAIGSGLDGGSSIRTARSVLGAATASAAWQGPMHWHAGSAGASS